MVCKKKKNRFIYVFLLSLILVCGLLQSSALSCNTYASNNGVTVSQFLQSQDFYDVCAWYFRKVGSIPDAFGGGTGYTYQAFADYLESQDKSYILQENVEVTESSGASGGRGYDLPQDARQEIINFVQSTVIESEPLTYVQATIPSYKNMGTGYFSNYTTYQTLQTYMANQSKKGGYLFFVKVENTSSYGFPIWVISVPTSLEWNFYGTVNSDGTFNNVMLGVNWQGNPSLLSIPNYPDYTPFYNGIECFAIRSDNGSQLSNKYFGNSVGVGNFYNSGSISTSSYQVFSSSNTNELVYVFNTMNAYKAYNAGNPQPYYLLSNPNYVAPSYDPVTDSQLQGAGNFYNSIVNNLNAGDSANDVQKTVKNGLLGGLLDTLTGSNSTTATENGNFDMTFLGTIKDLVLGVTGAIDPAQQLITTDLKRFVTDIFGWLPAEVVTFWIAGILFSVLFGVLKIVRG